LPDFIASIEAQTFDLNRVEVIAVDDGSTDDSLRMLEQWAQRRTGLVRVLSKENGGQGSARNLGLTVARGEWVTFPDPDDTVAPDYLERVDTAIAAWPTVSMIATNRLIWSEATGARTHTHPLAKHFLDDRLIDLEGSSRYFHGSAPAAFMRLSTITRSELVFDRRVQPNFEDGHFCARYLLRSVAPSIGFLASAHYHYRKRNDGTSTLDTKRSHPGHYLDVPRYGYLGVLQEAITLTDRVPEWLQALIVYELSWYFTEDEKMTGGPGAAHGELAEQFVSLLRRIAAYLDPQVVMAFDVRPIKMEIREILAYSLRDEHYTTPFAVAYSPHQRSSSTRVLYRFTHDEPRFQLVVDGGNRAPVAQKVQALRYFDHDLLFTQMIWTTGRGEIRLNVEGRPIPIRTSTPGAQPTSIEASPRVSGALRPVGASRLLTDFGRTVSSPIATVWRTRGQNAYSVIDDAARTGLAARRFHDAWVLMDRPTDANDNAEHLFRYLRQHRPDVNAWFVLAKGCPDWQRLVLDGYGSRLIAYESPQWKVLMRHCVNLIVSHPDQDVIRPRSLRRYWESWTVTFLQHGVMRDDISRWMNTKRFELFVTSTPAETVSVTGDRTAYKFTSFETKMVGLTRFDRLHQIGAQYLPEKRDLVLVAPTWRELLNKPLGPGKARREIVDDFATSEFARQWSAFFADPTFISEVEKRGKRVALLMHPNLQAAVHQLGLPASVLTLRFEGHDVQEYFARAALMVTDYSSMTFNEAFLLRPPVYFQFDRDTYYNGANHARAGYFDHVRDGFGPVAHTVQETHHAVLDLLTEVPQEYVDRMKSTFPYRDGRNRERTVTAIEDLHRPYEDRKLPELLPE